ncbi:hypothetical protein DERP_008372, partial [Dermatophagoides pteronyssinus]
NQNNTVANTNSNQLNGVASSLSNAGSLLNDHQQQQLLIPVSQHQQQQQLSQQSHHSTNGIGSGGGCVPIGTGAIASIPGGHHHYETTTLYTPPIGKFVLEISYFCSKNCCC